jgi:hypothetical protein
LTGGEPRLPLTPPPPAGLEQIRAEIDRILVART